MTFKEFYHHYSNEEACKLKLKSLRESEGIVCKKCGSKSHYWKKDKEQWQCKQCSFRTTLTSGTVMESSKLPLSYWFAAIHFLTVNKKSFSALSIQKELGHKRYEPIWAMLHKLRVIMGQRDSEYKLQQWVELDEGFFETVKPKDDRSEQRNKGRGAKGKSKVLVAIESNPDLASDKSKPHNKGRKAGFLKMIVMDDLSAKGIDYEVRKNIESTACVETDGYRGYSNLKSYLEHLITEVKYKEDASKLFPWAHVAISNAKRLLLDVWHRIDDRYLQNYLNEYCYRFNRRFMKENVFDRLLAISVKYTSYGYKSG
jgi:DNA-directed RNA polymerase subunit RPC12/RpoP